MKAEYISHMGDDFNWGDGMVVRKIPKETVSRWSYREGDEARLSAGDKIVTMSGGRKVIEKTKINTLAGYAVTYDMGQGALVRFSKELSGFGPTIKSAFEDYFKKNGGGL